MNDFIAIVAFAIVFTGLWILFDSDTEKTKQRRQAWLSERDCKRTAYHGDSVRGIWSCPDGQVYMLRDVPDK